MRHLESRVEEIVFRLNFGFKQRQTRQTGEREREIEIQNMAPTSYFEILAICLILLLPFLYETSHVFRYYFKFVFYYAVVSFNSIILIPPMLFRPCDVKNLL